MKDYYIYTRKEENNEFKIFIRLPPKSKYNTRIQDIFYSIIINENYPEEPPLLQCLTDVNYF